MLKNKTKPRIAGFCFVIMYVMPKKKIIFITILVLFISYITYINYFNQNKCFITLNGKNFNVSLATTPSERAQGLSGTEKLAQNSGKLFVFEKSDLHGFWMKDMNYPIDIIWFDENWEVVGLAQNIAPSTYPNVFYPQTFAKYVLEINANNTQELNFGFGQTAMVSCEAVLK